MYGLNSFAVGSSICTSLKQFEHKQTARKASISVVAPGVVCSTRQSTKPLRELNRRTLLSAMVTIPTLLASNGSSAQDCDSLHPSQCTKLKNLAPEEIAAIVREDLVKRQFLATADFSPEIYADDCIFIDEIDTYSYKDFVKGTKKLFDANQGYVNLVGDVEADQNSVSFRFDEELAFNIPFKPKTYLTGKLVLTRNADGLISSYKETWDQSVGKVLSTVHF